MDQAFEAALQGNDAFKEWFDGITLEQLHALIFELNAMGHQVGTVALAMDLQMRGFELLYQRRHKLPEMPRQPPPGFREN